MPPTLDVQMQMLTHKKSGQRFVCTWSASTWRPTGEIFGGTFRMRIDALNRKGTGYGPTLDQTASFLDISTGADRRTASAEFCKASAMMVDSGFRSYYLGSFYLRHAVAWLKDNAPSFSLMRRIGLSAVDDSKENGPRRDQMYARVGVIFDPNPTASAIKFYSREMRVVDLQFDDSWEKHLAMESIAECGNALMGELFIVRSELAQIKNGNKRLAAETQRMAQQLYRIPKWARKMFGAT